MGRDAHTEFDTNVNAAEFVPSQVHSSQISFLSFVGAISVLLPMQNLQSLKEKEMSLTKRQFRSLEVRTRLQAVLSLF